MFDGLFNASTILKVAMIAGVATTLSARAAAVPEKPNIILIVADDFGYECVGADGGESYETPVLDELAATGARFDHCYAQPLCTPSRVKLLTGIYNVRNYTAFGVLDRSQTTFARLLKAAGYATCAVGKWQLGKERDSPRHFGFDESCLWQHRRGRADENRRDTRYLNPHLEINGKPVDYHNGEYGPDVVCDYACEFIERHSDRPFLLYYPMILTHCPFFPTPDSPDWNPSGDGPKSYKGNPKYFGDMVAYTDKIVGRVVDKLAELRLREKTLILFTGDNGTDRPVVSLLDGRRVAGAKGETIDAGTHVPLIANWPGVIHGGTVCGDLVDFSDLLPTICQSAGVAVPERLNIDGLSFLPQLKGEKGNPRRWVYCWFSRDGAPDRAKVFARTKRYKLYRGGEFYDPADDELERHDLADEELDAEARQARRLLQRVLDRHENARPNDVQ